MREANTTSEMLVVDGLWDVSEVHSFVRVRQYKSMSAFIKQATHRKQPDQHGTLKRAIIIGRRPLPSSVRRATIGTTHANTKSCAMTRATAKVVSKAKLGRVTRAASRDINSSINSYIHRTGPLVLKHSKRHGLGVFLATDADAPYLPGQYIIAVRGKLLPASTHQSDMAQKYTWQPSSGRGRYVVEQLDTRKANIARYINASSTESGANVEGEWMCAGKVLVMRAVRIINPSDELLVWYEH